MFAIASRQGRARVETDDVAQLRARAPQPDVTAIARNDRAVDHDIVALQVESAIAVARGAPIAPSNGGGAALGREAVAVPIIVYRIASVAHGLTLERHSVCGCGEWEDQIDAV